MVNVKLNMVGLQSKDIPNYHTEHENWKKPRGRSHPNQTDARPETLKSSTTTIAVRKNSKVGTTKDYKCKTTSAV